ncbi:Hsp20/alpha crystallin family protein [Ferrovibrio xuzhouensis]|uniref:Hsp20/alpha crystallin family protein n=1 Tax=Ferrovibrio xuzhouensis TaxID=1576914 RepID=A0ABV7VAH7_9PROT
MADTQLVPHDPFESLHKQVDRLFGSFFNDFSIPKLQLRNGDLVPKLDFKETDKAYQIDIELPGIPAKDVEISVAKGILTVKGEKKGESEEKRKDYIRIERSYGCFERSLALPEDADDAKIEAASRDGVLTVTVTKKAGTAHATRKIEVKAA